MPSFLATNFRPPSPALPGAWPRTPLRSRSLTYPTSSLAVNSMQVDIAHVQQKLAAEPPVSLSSDETLVQSATTSSMPSASSQMTRFTSSTSMSALDTTLQHVSVDHKTASPISETRIYPYTRRASQKPGGNRSPSQTSETSFPPYSATPSPNSSPTSRTTSSLTRSPIVFVSPTSSNRSPAAIRRLRAVGNQSHSFTSDESAEYDDSGLLRLGSPSLPSSRASSRRQRDVSVDIASPITQSYGSSTEDLQIPFQPDLTSLSLPGSMDMDDSLDTRAMYPFVPLSPNIDTDAPWTLSLFGTPVSDNIELSPQSATNASPISISDNTVPLSPSLLARLQNPHHSHLVQFPSPGISTSPAQSTTSSPIEDFVRLETDAVEYANVLTSGWSSPPQIDPIGLEFSNVVNSSEIPTERPEHEQRIVITLPQKLNVLSKVKRFGSKVKHILQGKSKESRKIEVSPSRRMTNTAYTAPNPIARSEGESSARTPPALERLDLGSLDLERHIAVPYRLPSPSGPLTRARKPRPSITTQTYAPTATDYDAGSLGWNDSVHTDTANPVPSPAGETATPEQVHQQLEAHARPKTLDEIKNKRRLSLSAMTNHLARPSTPSQAGSASGPPTAIPITQRRARPTSAIILPSIDHHSSPSSPGPTRNVNHASIPHPAGPADRRSSIYPPPPGLDAPSPHSRARAVRLDVPAQGDSPFPSRIGPIPRNNAFSHLPLSSRVVYTSPRTDNGARSSRDQEHSQQQSRSERNRNRFSLTTSLSTLSSFAAGLVDHGSWAKFDTIPRS